MLLIRPAFAPAHPPPLSSAADGGGERARRQALVAVSSAVSTALQAAALWWWRGGGGGGGVSAVRTPLTLPCGPYGLLFALLVQYVCDVPAGSHFAVAGLQVRTLAQQGFFLGLRALYKDGREERRH